MISALGLKQPVGLNTPSYECSLSFILMIVVLMNEMKLKVEWNSEEGESGNNQRMHCNKVAFILIFAILWNKLSKCSKKFADYQINTTIG